MNFNQLTITFKKSFNQFVSNSKIVVLFLFIISCTQLWSRTKINTTETTTTNLASASRGTTSLPQNKTQTKGAYEIAKLVIKGIRDNGLKLANSILPTVPEIDSAKPGKYDDFYWPLSPLKEVVKPDGN